MAFITCELKVTIEFLYSHQNHVLVVRIRHQLTPQVVEPGQKIMTKL